MVLLDGNVFVIMFVFWGWCAYRCLRAALWLVVYLGLVLDLWFWCFVVDFVWCLSGVLVFGAAYLGCSGLLVWVLV